jgi:GNAT superfamily N-acetyltransferase
VSVVIGPADERDTAAIAEVMAELDRHYGATEVEPPDERTEQISRLLFGSQPAAFLLLARDGDQVVGMAAYSFVWPAVGTTSSLYLKELYVRGGRRRMGIGRLLLGRVFAVADERGCSRVEWTTERDNLPAQSFYAKLGLQAQDGKVLYRVEGSGTAAAESRLAEA